LTFSIKMNCNFILRPIWRTTSKKLDLKVGLINKDLRKLGFNRRVSKVKILDMMVNRGLEFDSLDLIKLANRQI